MAVGILGGAFDPPHNGHVALARTAIDDLGLSRLLVTVVVDPGHKRVATPVETRLRLAQLAFADIAGAEVEREPHARTVDALEARGLAQPVFVIGADELVDFARWKEPERVLELAELAVATRPGYPRERLEAALAALPEGARVRVFELQPLRVSSSEIRARAARGEPIGDLVPRAVAAEIERLGLYRDG